MKKKIIIILSLFVFFFIFGGIYIISSIEKVTSRLDSLIVLYQVEIRRERLLLELKKVQNDLSVKGTRYASSVDSVIDHFKGMKQIADTCLDCHHSEKETKRLNNLKAMINEYKDALNRTLTISANTSRVEAEQDNALRIGHDIINEVEGMIIVTNAKLENKTQSTLKDVNNTKIMLYMLITMGPFAITGLGLFFIISFTKPINILLDATRKLKSGDLGYRISGLKDEFGEVATSFNEMSNSLKEHMLKIQESEKRYRMLFESAGDAIFILDTERENAGKIISANRAAAEMYGYTIDELLKLNMIKDLDAPDAANYAPDRIKRILNGEWIKTEIMHRKKDGAVFPVEMSAGLLEFMGHKYIIAFDRDISERKRIEETLKKAEQMKLVGEWAVGLTHEIKNSLAGIKISVEVLLEELSVSEEDKAIILKVVDEIKRIELLLKSLLSFAKPSKLQPLAVNVNEILDKTIDFSLKQPIRSSNTAAKIDIVKDFDGNIPNTMADPLQLQQVFTNIFLNSAEALRNGGTITVKTSYDAGAGAIKVEISDNGAGIDEKILNKIFDPFFTTKSKGTGLGLAITKRIVERHGGEISVGNRPGGGVIFHISLPVKQVEEEQ